MSRCFTVSAVLVVPRRTDNVVIRNILSMELKKNFDFKEGAFPLILCKRTLMYEVTIALSEGLGRKQE